MKNKDNHYIARFQLAHFGVNKLLYGYDIATGTSEHKGPKGFAYSYELYRSPTGGEDVIEDGFGGLENNLARIIRRVVADGTLVFLDKDEMRALLCFVAAQAGRLPSIRQRAMARLGRRASADNIQEEFIATMRAYFEDGGPVLSLSQARLLATYSSAFVMGDHPVVADGPLSATEIPNPLPRVWMPISPQYTIELCDPTVKIPGGRPMPDPRDDYSRWPVVQATHVVADAEVDALNARQVSASVEKVFSRDRLSSSWVSARRKAQVHLMAAG